MLLDMIGDRELLIRRESNSTPWLVDIIWGAAGRLGHTSTFSNQLTVIEDDHIPFLRAGVAAVDIIDLDNPTWHTPQDDLDHVSARSLQIVGDVVTRRAPRDREAARLRQVSSGFRPGSRTPDPDPESRTPDPGSRQRCILPP